MAVLKQMLDSEARQDLLTGARHRYGQALWLCRARCEDAEKDNAANGYDEIRFARAQLDAAELQLKIIRSLESKEPLTD